jgi:aspartyl-tRNA(Asn)/glutamyl-tRNA(Gln) amidotransferase subunit A
VSADASDLFASATTTRDAIVRGEISAEQACQRALDRIAAANGPLHAFHLVAAERAVERARALDRAKAPAGPLHGVPIALKDNIAVRGIVATAGSRILEHYVSPFDATVTERLEQAGAVIVGKTVCDEFAMGSSTENCAFGPSRNPWALDRTPGGSSGGSAVAVAAGMTPIALGSDTGGSIRQPAALCGIVGMKPTYGRVSRFGLIAFASSLDQIGPFARTVEDAALCLEVMSGADPRDATAAVREVPKFSAEAGGDLKGLRIGVPARVLASGVDQEVRAAFEESVRVLTQLGATVRDVELPHSHLGIPVYYLVATAEASANLARYDGVRYGLRATPGARDASWSLDKMYDATRRAGFGEAPHHAGHLRALGRLLRRVLPEGATGPHADPAGLRRGLRRRRCGGDADEPDPGVSPRRAHGGSAADVPRGRVHRDGAARRAAGDQRAVWVHRKPAADRIAVGWTRVGRSDAVSAGGRL